jgi:hypothetical protein
MSQRTVRSILAVALSAIEESQIAGLSVDSGVRHFTIAMTFTVEILRKKFLLKNAGIEFDPDKSLPAGVGEAERRGEKNMSNEILPRCNRRLV